MTKTLVMKNAILPTELVNVARCLEERLRVLKVESRRIAQAEWDTLPADIRQVVPEWIVQLLANHALAGGFLTYPDATSPFDRGFSFWDPTEVLRNLEADSIYRPLIEFGFSPFADENDGNVWVAAVDNGPLAPIYLLELSAWSGRRPVEGEELVFASSRLALLLASMAVSRASYGDSPTSVLWYPEQPEG
jgi:hypothetical protein